MCLPPDLVEAQVVSPFSVMVVNDAFGVLIGFGIQCQ